MTEKLYKVLIGNKSCHGGSLEWPLPTKTKPGKWVTFRGKPIMCQAGLHATTRPAYWWVNTCSVYECEADKASARSGDDDGKSVHRKMRLIRLLNADELAETQIFSGGSGHIIKKFKAILLGSSSAVLWDSSSAVLRDSSRAELWDSSSAVLRDSSRAELLGSSRAELLDSSRAELWGSSSAVLWGSSRAELRGSSSAVLWGSSSAVLRDSSSAICRRTDKLKMLLPKGKFVVEEV